MRDDELPLAKLSLPGSFLAMVTNSATLLAGKPGATSIICTPLPSSVSGAKSLTGS